MIDLLLAFWEFCTLFQGVLKSLKFYQYCLKVLFSHNTPSICFVFAWLTFAILIWKDKNLKIVLIYIYIPGSDNEHFLRDFFIHVFSSFEYYSLRYKTYF